MSITVSIVEMKYMPQETCAKNTYKKSFSSLSSAGDNLIHISVNLAWQSLFFSSIFLYFSYVYTVS
jgi:hypothetical protein